MWPKERWTPLSFSPELYSKTQRAAEQQKKKKKRGEYNNNKLEINFETRERERWREMEREKKLLKFCAELKIQIQKRGKIEKKFTPTKAVLVCTLTIQQEFHIQTGNDKKWCWGKNVFSTQIFDALVIIK